MRHQLIVSIALLYATLSATTSSAESALDHVLATVRDLRAVRGSKAKIKSHLLPPHTAAPSAGRLAAGGTRERGLVADPGNDPIA